MAKLSVKQVHEEAKRLLREHPSGMRFSSLWRTLAARNPETPEGTVYTSIGSLPSAFPAEVIKPSRGLYQLAELAAKSAMTDLGTQDAVTGSETDVVVVPPSIPAGLKEQDFYAAFADWLRDDLDEASVAVELGGAGLKTKWGTPDVVGTYKPQADHLYRFPIELVAAEIKIDPSQSVVAFGQAVAYRLFAHKSYMVMPTTLGEDEQARLESLCLIFGVGLVLFDLNKDAPNYSIRSRAQRFNPDVFYINEFMQRLQQHNLGLFRQLFA